MGRLCKGTRAFHLLYLNFSLISSLWEYVPFNFEIAGHVASRGALDAITSNKVCRSRGLGSTRSPSNARAERRIIDCLSEHRTLKIKSRFWRSWGDMWTHQNLSIKIKWAVFSGSWDRGIMAHDHHPIKDVHSSSPNRTVCDFCVIFL